VGCDAYLTKPFSPLALIETVASMLSTPAAGPVR
jgi:CheY-like chemotaxis protein